MPYSRLVILSLTAASLIAAEKPAADGGISFTYDDASFPTMEVEQMKKLTNQQNGTDIPSEVGPKHSVFYLWDKHDLAAKAAAPQDSAPFARSHVTVFPLSDASVPKFAKAYPDISNGARDLAAFLKKAPKEIAWISQKVPPEKRKTIVIPELTFFDAATAFQAKLHYFENEQLHGVFYLTEYTQEESFYPTNEDLYYVFSGLSKDGRFSILAEFAVTHPSVPANFDAAPASAKTGKTPEAELKKVVAALAGQADDSFAPKLGELQAIVGSLKLPAK